MLQILKTEMVLFFLRVNIWCKTWGTMKITVSCERCYEGNKVLKFTKFRPNEILFCFKYSIALHCLGSVALIISMTFKSSLQHGC